MADARCMSFLLFTCLTASSFGYISKDTSLHEIEELAGSSEFVIVVTCAKLEQVDCVEALEELDMVHDANPPIGGTTILASTDRTVHEKYSVQDLPTVIFFRHSVPIFYEGEMDGDDLVFWLEQNMEVRTTTLTDNTLEHDTQATSGATTGNWYIMFYNSKLCDNFHAVWETVGSRSAAHSMVMGKVDLETNPRIVDRFKLSKCLNFVVFSRGKMFVHNGVQTLPSLTEFGRFYNKNTGTDIPIEPSTFENIRKSITTILTDYPVVMVAVSIVTLGILVTVLVLAKRKRPVKFD